MQVAARWIAGGTFAGALVLLLLSNVRVVHESRGPAWKASSPVIELGRCPDSKSQEIGKVNRDYDYCVARYFYELGGIRELDGQFALITASDSWLRVCAEKFMCSKNSTPDHDVEAWRLWDARSMFMGSALPCIAVYDGAARVRLGDDGWPIEIESEAGTELDRCLVETARPVVLGATDD